MSRRTGRDLQNSTTCESCGMIAWLQRCNRIDLRLAQPISLGPPATVLLSPEENKQAEPIFSSRNKESDKLSFFRLVQRCENSARSISTQATETVDPRLNDCNESCNAVWTPRTRRQLRCCSILRCCQSKSAGKSTRKTQL